MKAKTLEEIYSIARNNTYSEFENIVHKYFRGTLETVAKEKMVLIDADEKLPSYTEINQEADNYAKGFDGKTNGMHQLDFFNGVLWLKQKIELIKTQ